MGKRIDELPVDDTPITPTAAPDSSPDDPRGTPWYAFSVEIEDLLATGRYTWAEATLRGIYETVLQTQRVTEGQRKAVGNIETGGTIGARQRRRYEGYSW